MTVLALILAISLIFAAGFGLALILWRGQQPILGAEVFGLSWLLGAAFVSATLAIGGIALNGSALLALTTMGCLALLVQGIYKIRKGARIDTGFTGSMRWERWTCLLVLLPIITFVVKAHGTTIAWDGLLIWEFKARSAFLSGGSLPASYFSDLSRIQFHPTYPLYLPFTELWVYLWIGDCDQETIKVLFPIFYAAGISLLWAGACRLSGKVWIASLSAVMPVAIPLLSTHGLGLIHGYCDYLLASMYFASFSALLTWRLRGIPGTWFVSAICAGLLPWIKQEGVVLFGTLVVVSAIAHGWRNWKHTLFFALPGIAVAGSWKLALWSIGASTEEVFQAFTVASFVENLPRLQTIISVMLANLFSVPHWSILWFLATLALICLKWTRNCAALYLAIAIALPLSIYILPYMFTRIDLGFHLVTSIDRLILQVSMVAVLAVSVALGAVPRSSAREERTEAPTGL